MIRIQNLSKSYGENRVLNSIDIEFNKGVITAILGPNGSGKTTLMKSILGMVIPDSGKIYFQDQDIRNQSAYRDQIIHLPQIALFPENLTPSDLIYMIQDIRPGATRTQELIALFDLHSELKKKMRNLSGGNLQKVNLVLALMYDSPVLLLDEPSTGLDPLAMTHLKKFLLSERKKNKFIFFTTHLMSLVEDLADDVVFLLDGNIHFHNSLHALLELQNETKLETAIAKILQSSMSV